MESCFAEKKF